MRRSHVLGVLLIWTSMRQEYVDGDGAGRHCKDMLEIPLHAFWVSPRVPVRALVERGLSAKCALTFQFRYLTFP